MRELRKKKKQLRKKQQQQRIPPEFAGIYEEISAFFMAGILAGTDASIN